MLNSTDDYVNLLLARGNVEYLWYGFYSARDLRECDETISLHADAGNSEPVHVVGARTLQAL